MSKSLVKSGKVLMAVGVLISLTFRSLDESTVATLVGMILLVVGARRVQLGSGAPLVGKIITSIIIGEGSGFIGFSMLSTVLKKLESDKIYNLLALLKDGNWKIVLPALVIMAVGLMVESYMFYLVSGEMYKATGINTFKNAQKLYKVSIWSIPLVFGIFVIFVAYITFIVAGFSELVNQEDAV